MRFELLADSATAATWFGGVGGWLAAFATVAAVLVALSIANRDRAHLQAERRDREAGQARVVLAELTRSQIVVVEVTNHSESPIMALVLEYVSNDENPEWGWKLNENTHQGPAEISVLPAGESHSYPVRFTDNAGEVRLLERGPQLNFHFRISFTDSCGLRWHRSNNEQPERILGTDRRRVLAKPATLSWYAVRARR
jgi:hypothetical protein